MMIRRLSIIPIIFIRVTKLQRRIRDVKCTKMFALLFYRLTRKTFEVIRCFTFLKCSPVEFSQYSKNNSKTRHKNINIKYTKRFRFKFIY